MKKLEQYFKWILIFIVGVALIAVYKTFDNLQYVLSFFGKVFSAGSTFIIGFIIAYILNIPVKRLEVLYGKSKLKFLKTKNHILSIITVYCFLLIIIAFVIRMIIPNLYSNIVDLYNNIIPFTQNALNEIQAFQEKTNLTFIEINDDTVRTTLQRLLNDFNVGEFGKYAKGAISFTSGVFNLFIALIISIYMLLDREHLIHCVKRAMEVVTPDDKEAGVIKYAKRINEIFKNYISSCVMDAIIAAVATTIILSLLGVKYSIIFGALIGVCNLIPYFGAIVSIGVTVIVTGFSNGIMKAIWVAISLFVFQQIDGNIIGPKIMGSKLDANPLIIIFAVTLGGGLFGIGGMVLSVPVIMVVKMLATEFVDNLEDKKRNNTEREN